MMQHKLNKGDSSTLTGLSGFGSGASRATTISGVGTLKNMPKDDASVEQALLAQWNVKPITRKKVSLKGKEVQYSFKFSNAGKQSESS